MSNQKHFASLISKGNPIGEIVSVEKFIVKVKGLQPCTIHTLVMFEDGTKGYVHQITEDYVLILHIGTTPLHVGMIAVAQYGDLVTKVGQNFIGRVISVTAEPLDGKGPLPAEDIWPVFNSAPPINARRLVQDQVESGVVAIDSLFPIVKGQRMALLGDTKSGKSTIATQLTINQKNTDQIVVYCLISKRRSDVDSLLNQLNSSGSMEKAIVVVATMFDSLVLNYLAPYVACSIAEYFWQSEQTDTIIVYDDLTSHAHTYREISLLSNVSPGRDSYPGDMFYAHSSLLERAGRLDSTGKSLTSIPIIHAANGDITAYLPTNVMSISDGQWILDMATFKKGIRPAINIGLSVTRAGGLGHNKRQKEYASKTMKLLADYRAAEEYSHFGSELALDAKKAFETGKKIFEIITQSPSQVYSLLAQQLMFEIVLNLSDMDILDMGSLKQNANKFASQIKKDEEFNSVKDALKQVCVSRVKGAPAAKTNQDSNQPANQIVQPSTQENARVT